MKSAPIKKETDKSSRSAEGEDQLAPSPEKRAVSRPWTRVDERPHSFASSKKFFEEQGMIQKKVRLGFGGYIYTLHSEIKGCVKKRPGAKRRYDASLGFPFLIILLVSVDVTRLG